MDLKIILVFSCLLVIHCKINLKIQPGELLHHPPRGRRKAAQCCSELVVVVRQECNMTPVV